MDAFDKIFTKNNIDENQKKAKMYFGRMLIKLRSENHIKLYSLMESVTTTDLVGNVLKVNLADGGAYAMLSDPKDIATINEVLDGIERGLTLKLTTTGTKTLDVARFEEYLKQEFGKIVVIK